MLGFGRCTGKREGTRVWPERPISERNSRDYSKAKGNIEGELLSRLRGMVGLLHTRGRGAQACFAIFSVAARSVPLPVAGTFRLAFGFRYFGGRLGLCFFVGSLLVGRFLW